MARRTELRDHLRPEVLLSLMGCLGALVREALLMAD
jgi:hypothetical protein